MHHEIRPGTRFCIISHTHWDREWYWPFEVFRTRLVDLIDHVLEILAADTHYIFHLDAQTIVLDDYLAIRPENRGALREHVAAGRLLVGPWYVQNDLALTSGELTVRNLLIGTAIAREFGGDVRVGYTPDQFGLPDQLPQLLNGFGIDHCVFGRGYALHDRTPEGIVARRQANEFTWAGPADSAVLGVFMRTWYNNAQRFSADIDRSERFLAHIDAGLCDTARTPLRLCMNGVDHLEAQPDLTGIIRALNERLRGTATVAQVTLPDYIRDLRDALGEAPLDEWRGELREGPDGSVLQGTLSSRPYLKTGQVRCQVLLENLLEPLYTLAALAGWPEAWPKGYLLYLWKILLENSAHDNICGCSRDAVHRHMEDRYARIEECGGELLRRGVKFLADRLADAHRVPDQYLVTLVNTLSFPRDILCETTLHLPEGESLADLTLHDPAGAPVAFDIVSQRVVRKGLFSPDNLPGDRVMTEYVVRFPARALPAFGHAVYRFIPGAPGAAPAPARSDRDGVIEAVRQHAGLRVHPDGRIDLWSDRANHWHEDVLRFTVESDLGSAYAFVPAPGEEAPAALNLRPEVSVLEHTPHVTRVELAFDIAFGAAWDWEAGARTAETARIPVRLQACVDDLHDHVAFDLRLDNHVRDCRVRMHVRTDCPAPAARAASPLGWVERAQDETRYEIRQNRCEPSQGFVYLEGEKGGFAVFSEALTEYEHLGDAPDVLACSLLRATASHTAPGLVPEPTPQDMPEEWVSPENQCLRVIEHRFALAPGRRDTGALARDTQAFQVPVPAHFDSGDRRKLVGGRPSVQQTDLQETFYREPPESERRLGLVSRPVEVHGDGVVATALKVAARGGATVLRLVNMREEPSACRVRVNAHVRRVCRARLDETPGRELPLDAGAVAITLASLEIATLLLYPDA